MQTRRDQLQAYRFQNRRALAALVVGEPNVVDPPMRRLTVTTISGVMIAVLITVGFTVFGLIRPKAGDSWKTAGSIIVEDDSGATFVYLNGELRPVVNYTSGVLALGGTQRPTTVRVTAEDIRGAPRGSQIGITGLPSSLPAARDLVSAPVAACSRQQAGSGDQFDVRVSVRFGDDLGARPIDSAAGVLVDTGAGSSSFLLLDGRRLAIAAGRVTTALGYADRQPLQVGRAFLNAVPQGPALRAPTIAGAGRAAPLPGVPARVGQLIATPGGRYYVAMPDGRAAVTPIQQALLQTLPIGPGATLLEPIAAAESTVLQLPQSAMWNSVVSSQLAGLPAEIPALSTAPASAGGICAAFGANTDRPRLATPATSLPSFRASRIGESETSLRGQADSVVLPPGRAALVRGIDGAPTVFLVGDSGRKFAAAGPELLGGFGYGSGVVTPLPASLLTLVPTGPAMSKTAALTPVN